jgi:hypothetical protein
MYNLKKEQLSALGHAVDLTITHPTDDNAYRYFDFTTCSTATLTDIKSASHINPDAVPLKAILAKQQLYFPIQFLTTRLYFLRILRSTPMVLLTMMFASSLPSFLPKPNRAHPF